MVLHKESGLWLNREPLKIVPHQRMEFFFVLPDIFKKPKDCCPELFKFWVELQVYHLFAHELPQPFDEVQVGRIGRTRG